VTSHTLVAAAAPVRTRLRRVVCSPVLRFAVLGLALAAAAWNLERTPSASLAPALVGLAPWVIASTSCARCAGTR
jgi:hypothetical protein